MMLSRLLSSTSGTPDTHAAIGLFSAIVVAIFAFWHWHFININDFADAEATIIGATGVGAMAQGVQRKLEGDKPVDPCPAPCPPRQEAASTP